MSALLAALAEAATAGLDLAPRCDIVEINAVVSEVGGEE
jgi:hypothetical protein